MFKVLDARLVLAASTHYAGCGVVGNMAGQPATRGQLAHAFPPAKNVPPASHRVLRYQCARSRGWLLAKIVGDTLIPPSRPSTGVIPDNSSRGVGRFPCGKLGGLVETAWRIVSEVGCRPYAQTCRVTRQGGGGATRRHGCCGTDRFRSTTRIYT